MSVLSRTHGDRYVVESAHPHIFSTSFLLYGKKRSIVEDSREDNFDRLYSIVLSFEFWKVNSFLFQTTS